MITSRRALISAQRTSERRLDELFASLLAQVAGLLAMAADADGVVPLRDADQLLARIRTVVEAQFVRRVSVSGVEYEAELARLQVLVDTARDAVTAASQAQRARALGRLQLLTDRYALLAGSQVALRSIQGGAGLTPYATVVVEQARAAALGAIEPHVAFMATAAEAAPDLATALRYGTQISPRLAAAAEQYGSVLTWQDARGYTLSDRIWRTGEATRLRIDALLRDGIAEGRSAVDIAKDLEQFLKSARRGVLTKTPYGTTGSFDARRLARSEITRAHALASHEAALSNPFVRRGHWRLSSSHAPNKCDGSCDALAALDEAQGGWALENMPVPIDDTHPSCLCTTWYETAPIEETLDLLREQLRGGGARTTPVTAMNTDALVNVVTTGANSNVAA